MYMCMSVCVSHARESWGGLRRLANKTDVRKHDAGQHKGNKPSGMK